MTTRDRLQKVLDAIDDKAIPDRDILSSANLAAAKSRNESERAVVRGALAALDGLDQLAIVGGLVSGG